MYLSSEADLLTHLEVVHGLSVPIGKLGYRLPRTLSGAIGSNSVSVIDPEGLDPPFRLRERTPIGAATLGDRDLRLPGESSGAVFQIGGSIIQSTKPEAIAPEMPSTIRRTRPPTDIASENKTGSA